MSEQKKQPRKNPSPLVVKGIFYVTAEFEDKQYVVSNGLSFIRFKKDDEDIKKGDYLVIHGPVYQRKDAANAIITGEAVVTKMTEQEVDEYKAKISEAIGTKYKQITYLEKKSTTKKSTAKKSDENKLPWE